MYNIWEIHDMLGFVDQPHSKYTVYSGTFSIGAFDAIYDYDAGIVTVSLTTCILDKDHFGAAVNISTIDDGDWQANSNVMSLDEANALVEEIYKEWEWKTKLPTEKELNEFLVPFKMYGTYTG